ncbi:MAG: tripartite tricarboxylate transporter substrate binding protein [Burkholderiales bacterium]|nr:tripartite tricarboxylate transporter substrate binding protein [Burkholderiales bacterium]
MSRGPVLLAMSALMGMLAAAAAQAQQWPQKTIRMIVPFPPGGGNDLIGRIVAQELTKRLSQTVYVENRAGANGIIGLQGLKQLPADGYTIATSSDGPLVINPAVRDDLPYDTQRDFAPVALAITQPLVLVVHPSMPVRNVRALIDLARTKPGAVAYSSFGLGNISHLSGELLGKAGDARFLHVPYKGGEPATIALISGEVQFMFGTVQNVIEHTRRGKLVALGTGEPAGQRLPMLPAVPAIADTLQGYETKTWNGFVVRAGTPAEIVARLGAEIGAIVRESEISARLIALGATPAPLGPAQFGTLMRRDAEKWAALAKARNIRVQ